MKSPFPFSLGAIGPVDRVARQGVQMNALTKTIGTALIVGVLSMSISACQKEEGPMERAGKDVDQAVEKAGEKMEEVGDSIQDAAKDGKQ